jgi:hypothetical protein
VDVTIAYPHPHSLAADHSVELVHGGAPYDVVPMHKICNENKEIKRKRELRMLNHINNANASREW